MPQGEWCAVKHYGTICGFHTGFDKTGPFSSDVTGCDIWTVWVSRTHGKLTVADLGQRISVRIAP